MSSHCHCCDWQDESSVEWEWLKQIIPSWSYKVYSCITFSVSLLKSSSPFLVVSRLLPSNLPLFLWRALLLIRVYGLEYFMKKTVSKKGHIRNQFRIGRPFREQCLKASLAAEVSRYSAENWTEQKMAWRLFPCIRRLLKDHLPSDSSCNNAS